MSPTRKPSRAIDVRFLNDDMQRRFWSAVAIGDACWTWTKAISPAGYGVTSSMKVTFLAHRVAWFLGTGIEPGDGLVCHKCDNPPCVRPSHLFLGTDDDNLTDMRAKGRGVSPVTPRGTAHHNAKLSPEDAREMRALRSAGLSERVIASRFGVAKSTCQSVLRNLTWREVG